MEDEQDAVGQGSGGGASSSPSSDNLPSEVGDMGSDNQVQESYQEADGEEIMVEVVGSDVYVDGVSAHKEGQFESGEVGNLEDHVVERTKESEIHNLSEGDGNKVKESDLESSDSRDGKDFVAIEKLDGSFSKPLDDKGNTSSALLSRGGNVIDDEAQNPWIEALDGSSSGVSVPNSEVTGPSSMVISEEKRAEDEDVIKDCSDLQLRTTPEPSDLHAEAIFDENADIEEKKQVLHSSDNAESCDHFSSQENGPTEVVKGPSFMVISEEKRTEDETVSKDSADLATSAMLNHPAEAVLDKKADLEENKEVFPSSDNSASRDHFSSAARTPTEEVTGSSALLIGEEKKAQDEAVSKDSGDLVTTGPLNRPAEAFSHEEADLAEKKEELPATDYSAGHNHFSSALSMPTEEVMEPSSLVISEENKNVAEEVTKDSTDLVISETLNHHAEAVSDEKADIAEKKELLPSPDDVASRDHFSSAETVPSGEAAGPSPLLIREDKKTEVEAVAKDSDDLVTPEILDHHAEAVSDEKAHIEDKEELLPSSDKSESDDHFDADSVISHGETKAAQGGLWPAEVFLNPNTEGSENVQVDGIDTVGEEVHLVNASAGELSDSFTHEDGSFRVKDERATTEGDGGIDGTSVDGKENFAAENKESILESDALVSDVQDENQGRLNEFHDIKLDSDDQIEGASHAGPESIHDNSFASETGATTGNDECLKNDGGLETHKARENQVFSNEPNQLTDRGDTDVAEKDKCLNVEIQDDKEKNDQNMTGLSCPPDKEIVQADSGRYSSQPVIAATLGAEKDSQDAVISQAEAVDGGGSSEKSMEINPEIPALDDSAENMHIQEEGACEKVEREDVRAMEHDDVFHNLIVNSESFESVVEMPSSPHSTKQEVSAQITESSIHEVDKVENNLAPNEVLSTKAVCDITQVCIPLERTEKAELLLSSNISLHDGGAIKEKPGCDVASMTNEVYESREEEPGESNGFCIVEGQLSETEVTDKEEEKESNQTSDEGKEFDAELGSEEPSSEIDQLKLSNDETVKYASSLKMGQSGYLTPPEGEGSFAQSDLVWGKVRSHPWWPGQIFDPAIASEKALKYQRKDSYLVAYYGDQTFAWNDSSALKPFRSHFSQIEKQSNSESFHNAVNCALEEVQRRVELGLACSCIPKDEYAKIETQVVENAGIREEASHRRGVDQSSQASHFEPDKLLEYVMGLAPCASSWADLLDLVIARAQLSAFCRFKGYRSLTEFPLPGELLENDVDTEQLSDEITASKKRKLIPEDGSQSRKEKSMTELVGDREYSPDAEDELVAEDIGKSVSLSSGKKWKALDPPAEGPDKRVSIIAEKVSTSASQTPKPSFKIGECIRRVASQLTGSTSSIKGGSDETVTDGSVNMYTQSDKQSMVVSSESLSINEMLSQLELLAENPKKRHHSQKNIRAFFLGFRSSIILNRRGRKKKSEQTKGGSGEEFEFDDVNDSYWTDRIVQNYSEEQLLHESENGDKNLQLVLFDTEKPIKTGRKSHSRKRFSSGMSPTAATEEDENAKRRKEVSSPAELILSFAERNCVPSEINLNKMFRRFGPLMESETEVDHESGCAKVIFKRGSDAEVARNSAEKFNVFGPVLVNYQIGYSPVISVKVLPVAIPQPQEDATMML